LRLSSQKHQENRNAYMAPKLPTDFDAVELTTQTKQHGEDITGLSGRVKVLEDKLGSPAAIAGLLEYASDDSKKLDKLFASVFCSLLKDEKTNPAVREAIEDIVNKSDRKQAFHLMKKWGGVLWSGLMVVLGVVLSLLVDLIKKKFNLN